MKRSVCILTCILLLLCVVLSVVACDREEPDRLVIYNWADYIFSEKLDEFKQYYKDLTGNSIEITYVTFDTNETMLTRLTQGDSRVDVVCPSEYAIQRLIESNMLVPLHYFDEELYVESFSEGVKALYEHNSDNIEQGIIDKVGDPETFGNLTIAETGETVSMVDYFVPYMYGTLGILYNKYDFIDMGIYDTEIMNKANWGIFFNDDGEGNILHEDLTGYILMKDSIRDSYAATIFYLKQRGMLDGLRNEDGVLYTDLSASQLINAVDDQLLKIVRETLVEQKKELFGYEVDFGKDDMLQGNALVDLAWSGDALFAVEESWDSTIVNEDGTKGDYRLAYYVPHGAGNVWFDGWVVPKTYNPDHMDAIKIFINWLNKPEIAAQNLLEIGYTSAVSPKALQDSDEAMQILMEAYDYDFDDEDDYDAFVREFFEFVDEDGESLDEIGQCNWRYPFMTALNEPNPDSPYDRSIGTLGVMRDFGENNKKVVTAWNYARSAGVNALPLLGWTALAVVISVGVLFAVIGVRRWKSHTVKIKS
ncbi:MAG: extracellular solute-binding protein [Clostridiales bacterium]|nr:extracellular solute-binding protein [Clostridiales bacterium]